MTAVKGVTRRESLRAAVKRARTPGTALSGALVDLYRCREGSRAAEWAYWRVRRALPERSRRTYSTQALIDSVMVLDDRRRYVFLEAPL